MDAHPPIGRVVAEKPQNHYPHITNKSPYISNRDTTKKNCFFLQQIKVFETTEEGMLFTGGGAN
jgi:hypothetical protein